MNAEDEAKATKDDNKPFSDKELDALRRDLSDEYVFNPDTFRRQTCLRLLATIDALTARAVRAETDLRNITHRPWTLD